MKLGEALQLRSDYLKRATDLQQRIARSAVIQEGDKPPHDQKALLAELESLFKQTLELVQRINRTNVAHHIDKRRTIADAIAERDALTRHRTALVAIAEASVGAPGARAMRSEIRYVRTVDPQALRNQADACARERRELDVKIQQANWEVTLGE